MSSWGRLVGWTGPKNWYNSVKVKKVVLSNIYSFNVNRQTDGIRFNFNLSNYVAKLTPTPAIGTNMKLTIFLFSIYILSTNTPGLCLCKYNPDCQTACPLHTLVHTLIRKIIKTSLGREEM